MKTLVGIVSYVHRATPSHMQHLTYTRFLETMHTAFMLRQLYYLTILGFGDTATILKTDW